MPETQRDIQSIRSWLHDMDATLAKLQEVMDSVTKPTETAKVDSEPASEKLDGRNYSQKQILTARLMGLSRLLSSAKKARAYAIKNKHGYKQAIEYVEKQRGKNK